VKVEDAVEVVITRARENEQIVPALSEKEPAFEENSSEEPLPITVLFTTIEATLPALEEAHQLARGLGAQMRILMPQVVPYTLPLDRPAVDPAFRVRQLCGSLFDPSISVRIEVHLCRDLEAAVAGALRPGSLVVMGCRACSWLGRERSLARSLRQSGHQVILISNR